MNFKLLITEQPRTSHPLIMLARKNGQYNRPIKGASIDVRMEDMPGMTNTATERRIINFILPLPPVGDQRGKFAIMNFGFLDNIIQDGPELQSLITSNQYLVLPDNPQSELWALTKAPWWDFAEVLDEYDNPIKAALHPRAGESTAEEIDERLDEFEENNGKIEALSPLTLQKQLAGTMTESYLKKLRRI